MTVAFTDEQRHAIETRTGSLFLHANAGSGKTSVLVERFVRSVLEDDVPVDRILAITFTEKAAAELKLRIRARFLELGKREQARSAEGAWISTIHGFCSRLLRTHPLAAGIDPEYRVLDEPTSSRRWCAPCTRGFAAVASATRRCRRSTFSPRRATAPKRARSRRRCAPRWPS
jgi:ATP-dependent helicase/nuclease subunit A